MLISGVAMNLRHQFGTLISLNGTYQLYYFLIFGIIGGTALAFYFFIDGLQYISAKKQHYSELLNLS